MAGENFGKSGAIRQILPIQIYIRIIKLQVASTTNGKKRGACMVEISHYHTSLTSFTWLMVYVTIKSTHMDSLQSPLQPMSVSHRLPGSLSQGSYVPFIRSIPNYISLYSCHPRYYPLTTLDTANAHHFSATCDDKINICGFKFSVKSEWHVLIKEDKDNLLQFAKDFPSKFLKLLIHQSFSLPPFCTIWYKNYTA